MRPLRPARPGAGGAWSVAGPLALALLALLAPTRPVAADETADPTAASFYFAQAETQREAGRLAEATELYWKAIEADRGHYEAHVRFQAAALATGTALADLVADYDSFVNEFPDDPPLKLHRLRLEPAEGRAKPLAQLAKTSDPAHVAIESALIQLAADDAAKAARTLEPFGGTNDLALKLLVDALSRQGKLADAEKRLQPRLADPVFALEGARVALLDGRYEDAVARAEAVLAARPASTSAVLVKAEAQHLSGQDAPALETLAAGRRTTEDAVAVLLAYAEIVGRGEEAEKALAAAVEVYEGILAKDPNVARAVYGMAWVREREAKFAEAEALYRRCVALEPTDPACVESVGYMLFRQGRISDAQIQFRKAIDLDPAYASAYANLGATHDAKAEYAKALEWYEKLLKLPGQSENIRALINSAFDYEQLGAFPKAESCLRKAHDVRPDDADILVWLGDNLYFQEKWKEAEKTYLQALKITEKSFYAWRGLGLTFGQQEKWSDAAEALEKAKAIKPGDADLLLILAGLYLQELDDLEKALDNFEEYVQAGGDDPAVPETIQAIRRQLQGTK